MLAIFGNALVGAFILYAASVSGNNPRLVRINSAVPAGSETCSMAIVDGPPTAPILAAWTLYRPSPVKGVAARKWRISGLSCNGAKKPWLNGHGINDTEALSCEEVRVTKLVTGILYSQCMIESILVPRVVMVDSKSKDVKKAHIRHRTFKATQKAKPKSRKTSTN